jgi:hypothetical protein
MGVSKQLESNNFSSGKNNEIYPFSNEDSLALRKNSLL